MNKFSIYVGLFFFRVIVAVVLYQFSSDYFAADDDDGVIIVESIITIVFIVVKYMYTCCDIWTVCFFRFYDFYDPYIFVGTGVVVGTVVDDSYDSIWKGSDMYT